MCAPTQDTSTEVVQREEFTTSSSPISHTTQQQQQEQQAHNWIQAEEDKLQRATRFGAVSIGLLTMATTLAMPYAQSTRDELGCDSVCQGSMTSARSTLALIGATLVGRISDWGGDSNNNHNNNDDDDDNMRHWCLYVGVGAAALNLVMANRAKTTAGLWMSLIPNMLQQNNSIMRALVSDYHSAFEQTMSDGGVSSSSSPPPKTDRASSAGTLGMAGGLALMVGPFLGSSLLSTYEQATNLSLVLLLGSAVFIFLLPKMEGSRKKKAVEQKEDDGAAKKKRTGSLLSFLDVPSARTPAALFVLASRLLSSLSFQMFSVIWLPSLKERFQFGPKEYGIFFSVVGLFFALSQGLVSKWVLRSCAGNTPLGRSRLLALCTAISCIARYLSFYTTSLPFVYVLYAFLITAIGVSSTIFGADTSQIPAKHEVGSFFGIITAVESGAGMSGPLIASALASTIHPTLAPLYAVIFLNVTSVALTVWGYDRFVFQHIQRQKQQGEVRVSDDAEHKKQD